VKLFIDTKSDVIFNTINSFFVKKGYSCKRASDKIPSQDFDCLILDNPPHTILKEYKSEDPVVVLGDAGDSRFAFLEKPLKLEELFQLCLKLSNTRGQKAFTVGPYTIFPKTRYALHLTTGVQHALTEKEIAILEMLYHANDIVSKEAILENVWGYQRDIDTHTLETHIYKLRKKLIPDNEGEFLLTYPRGYRLKV
jgi:DNA-binding response OmpR family regulator